MADISSITLPDGGGTYNLKDSESRELISQKYSLPSGGIPVTDLASNARMVVLSYGHSTWDDFLAAYATNTVIYCKASSGSNPASGSQTRRAFLAYVDNSESPTNVEFQYYRSVNAHSASQQGDEVYVYKLTSSGTWTVTVRNTFTKIAAGTGLASNYNSSSGTLTLSSSVSPVTSITTGVGLDGGPITSTGEIKAKLRSETALTNDSEAATEVSGRVYPVAQDNSGYLAVNVPWTDTDTHHTAYLYAGASGGTANASTSTGDTYLNLVENGANRSGVKLVPGTNMSITSDGSGNVTFNATDTNTDTKVNVSLANTTQAYLMGTSTTPTGTATGVTAVADAGVYLKDTAGALNATSYYVNEAVQLQYNATTKSLDFIFV